MILMLAMLMIWDLGISVYVAVALPHEDKHKIITIAQPGPGVDGYGAVDSEGGGGCIRLWQSR